jgi:Holliday junction resolvase
MAITPEAKVKTAVRKLLDSLNIYHFMPPANGFGRAGIPDIVGCMDGHFIAIECKAGKGTTTALQDRELNAILNHGGTVFIAREDNLKDLQQLLRGLRDELQRPPYL